MAEGDVSSARGGGGEEQNEYTGSQDGTFEQMKSERDAAIAREAKLKAEVERMREHVLELEDQSEDSDANNEQAELLKQKLAHAHSELDETTRELEQVQQAYNRCQSELNTLKNVLGTHKAEKAARERAEADAISLREQLGSAHSSLEQERARCAQLSQSVEFEKQQRQSAEKAQHEAENAQAQLQEEYSRLRVAFEQLSSRMEEEAGTSSGEHIDKGVVASFLRQYLRSKNRRRSSEIFDLLMRALGMSDDERFALLRHPDSSTHARPKHMLKHLVQTPVRIVSKASGVVADRPVEIPTATAQDGEGNERGAASLGELWIQFLLSQVQEERDDASLNAENKSSHNNGHQVATIAMAHVHDDHEGPSQIDSR